MAKSPARPTQTPTATPHPVPASCPVTLPNGNPPPGQSPSPTYHGNGLLWTVLWPEGLVLVPPLLVQPDGSLAMKWSWWRGVNGPLAIEGRRLDKPDSALGVVIPAGYGDTGFQPGGLIFPNEGCWEVTGQATAPSTISPGCRARSAACWWVRPRVFMFTRPIR